MVGQLAHSCGLRVLDVFVIVCVWRWGGGRWDGGSSNLPLLHSVEDQYDALTLRSGITVSCELCRGLSVCVPLLCR